MKNMLMLATILATATTMSCRRDQRDTTPAYGEATTGTPTARATGEPVGGADAPTEELDDTYVSGEGELDDERLGREDDRTFVSRTGVIIIDPAAPEPVAVDEIVAVLAPMEGGTAAGTVHLRETPDGLALEVDLDGLPAGDAVLVVHTLGDCSAMDGTSAGAPLEYRPAGAEGRAAAPGELAMLYAGKDGKATQQETIADASLHGERSLIGRAVVLHEKDASGRPLACAVFGIAERAAPR